MVRSEARRATILNENDEAGAEVVSRYQTPQE
jgi:hypothetical protein